MASGCLKEGILEGGKEIMIIDEPIVHEKNCEEVSHHQNLTEEKEGTPRLGLIFSTCEDVAKFYNIYAQRIGFGIMKRSSNHREDGTCETFTLACDKEGKPRYRSDKLYHSRPSVKTNCKAKIIARLREDGFYYLNHVYLDHNHVISPSKSRFYKLNRRLPNHVKKNLEYNDGTGVCTNKSVQVWTKRMGGFDKLGFSEKECRNYVEKMSRLKLSEGDVEAIHNYFDKMQRKYPSFFYAIDIDSESYLRNVFWADSRSRSAYQYFGDVISFDTTYLTNKYNMPFAPFVGVNHHGQSILLGCALLANESIETYTWLFRTWLDCMSGIPPKAIITDQCKFIRAAIAIVFPDAHHRMCLWHIMKKIPQKLGRLNDYKSIKKKLKSIVYQSLRIEEFEQNWLKLIEEYKLEENEWLRSLYEIRCYWIPVYVKNIFWAGMSITQRSESMNTFFYGYIHSKTSLKQFLEKYDFALQSKNEKEALADFYSLNMSPPLISKYHLEKQMSEIYTFEIFKKFQDEIKAIIYCHTSLVKKDGFISTLEVLEHIMRKDGKSVEQMKYTVSYDEKEQKVWCICRLFEYRGILCRHVLTVLSFFHVFEIPSHYILPRWRKDFKRLHGLASTSSVDDNSLEQSETIHMHCLELADVALEFGDRYEMALKLIIELKETLLKEIVTFRISQENRNHATTLGGLGDVACGIELKNDQIEGNKFITEKICNPIPVRRKGRPPSKRKQSIVEKVCTEWRKQVSQRKNKTSDGNNVEKHDTPIGTQVSIDLIADTNFTDLSGQL